jgi:hypothetical protein
MRVSSPDHDRLGAPPIPAMGRHLCLTAAIAAEAKDDREEERPAKSHAATTAGARCAGGIQFRFADYQTITNRLSMPSEL